MQTCPDEILSYHAGGKIGTLLKKPLASKADLSIAYTPGVAAVVKAIQAEPESVFRHTAKANLVAVVTDGTAVLGLGDTGAAASIPVMEGKAVLFKAFADVDAWPVPLGMCRLNGEHGRTDPRRVIETVERIACMYGGINLEDIAAPACFEIEEELDRRLDIPVFHDDQWGTAVITLAAVMNYCELSGRALPDLKIVVNGAGAAGIRIADMLKNAGASDVTLCDSKGVITESRAGLTPEKQRHAVPGRVATLAEALRGANVFIGVSVADCLSEEALRGMALFPAVFAMANPDPEIPPEKAKIFFGARPYVMATGRSDYPNQINNVLGFPFLFRGALDARAVTINLAMKQACAKALAALAKQEAPEYLKRIYASERLEFGPGYIVPKPFDHRLLSHVAAAVLEAAASSGSARAAPAELEAAKRSLQQRATQREAALSAAAGV